MGLMKRWLLHAKPSPFCRGVTARVRVPLLHQCFRNYEALQGCAELTVKGWPTAPRARPCSSEKASQSLRRHRDKLGLL